jgi:hypothetical protein
MDNFNSRKEGLYKFVIGLLIIIMFSLQFWLKPIIPDVIDWITYSLIGLGLIIFIAASIITRRYTNDYQPTTLLGRSTSNINARKFLFNIGVGGCSTVVIGLIVVLIGSMISD